MQRTRNAGWAGLFVMETLSALLIGCADSSQGIAAAETPQEHCADFEISDPPGVQQAAGFIPRSASQYDNASKHSYDKYDKYSKNIEYLVSCACSLETESREQSKEAIIKILDLNRKYIRNDVFSKKGSAFSYEYNYIGYGKTPAQNSLEKVVGNGHCILTGSAGYLEILGDFLSFEDQVSAAPPVSLPAAGLKWFRSLRIRQ